MNFLSLGVISSPLSICGLAHSRCSTNVCELVSECIHTLPPGGASQQNQLISLDGTASFQVDLGVTVHPDVETLPSSLENTTSTARRHASGSRSPVQCPCTQDIIRFVLLKVCSGPREGGGLEGTRCKWESKWEPVVVMARNDSGLNWLVTWGWTQMHVLENNLENRISRTQWWVGYCRKEEEGWTSRETVVPPTEFGHPVAGPEGGMCAAMDPWG